jgi:hypothetical protein
MPDQKSSQAADAPKVVWDDSKMRSTYANVCNVASTREEVVVLFGTNQAWKAGGSELKVELSDRVILSPFAAKRLSLLLGNVVARYEAKFGSLDSLDSVVEQAASANKN